MRDTLPDAERVRRAAMRRLDPVMRLRQALELSDLLRRLRDLPRPQSMGEARSGANRKAPAPLPSP